jgi:hypothetical protein
MDAAATSKSRIKPTDYDEDLEDIADRIAREVAQRITVLAENSDSKFPYKARYVRKKVIGNLRARAQ